jgi:hypothetical protein
MEFDELMISYLDSVDPVWVDVDGVAPIDAQEEAYRDFRRAQEL